MAVALLAAVAGFHVASAAHAEIGTLVENVEMPLLEGGKARVLADTAVSVLVFFRPNQTNSLAALRDLAACQGSVPPQSARWVGIVSSSVLSAGTADFLRDTGFAMPVLVDVDDALYGSLGIALHPVVVIVDRDHRLAAFEPFRAVNFCPVVMGQLRFVLHEISAAQLQEILDPPRASEGGSGQVARTYRALADSLFKSGKLDKAAAYARKSLDADPDLAAAHSLLGAILQAQGQCAAAIPEYQRALALDGADAAARDGLQRCKPVQ